MPPRIGHCPASRPPDLAGWRWTAGGGRHILFDVRIIAGLLGLFITSTASGQTVVLYSNDFEHPNVAPEVNCGNSLDTRGIDLLYGAPGFHFQQAFTVELVVTDDPGGLYSDPSGVGGAYALGMLSTFQDDRLALSFDRGGRRYLNVGLDLSAIDVNGCGGPFGVAQPSLQLSLYDSPAGFDLAQPGTLLDQAVLTSTAPPSATVFGWQYGQVSLDAEQATTGTVTVVFDLLTSGYAAFDNLSIVAADETGIVDQDTDGVPDDTDNCPDVSNADQSDRDRDEAGDPCDPAPDDPTICGDRDGDGADDCAAPPDAGTPDTGATPDVGTPDTGSAPDAATDAGVTPTDAGTRPVDGGVPSTDDEGCGCTEARAHDGAGANAAWVAALLLLVLGRRRRR